MRTEPFVLRILKVASASQGYFCSTISSMTSTAKVPCTNSRNATARTMRAVAAALWAAQVTAKELRTCASHSEAATEEPADRLLIPQRYHGIDFHGAARGNVAGKKCCYDEHTDHTCVGQDIRSVNAVEHRPD